MNFKFLQSYVEWITFYQNRLLTTQEMKKQLDLILKGLNLPEKENYIIYKLRRHLTNKSCYKVMWSPPKIE